MMKSTMRSGIAGPLAALVPTCQTWAVGETHRADGPDRQAGCEGLREVGLSGREPLTSAFGDDAGSRRAGRGSRSEEHTSELQSRQYLVCRLLLEKKNNIR